MKIKKSWAVTLIGITYLLLAFSTLTKLLYIPYIATKFEILGIAPYGRLFGAIELIAFILYLNPRTIGLGFVLLCSYFGGAIATDLHAPQFLYQPVTVLAFVFIATYLRKPGIYSDRLTALHKSCCTIVSWQKN